MTAVTPCHAQLTPLASPSIRLKTNILIWLNLRQYLTNLKKIKVCNTLWSVLCKTRRSICVAGVFKLNCGAPC